MYAHVCGCSRVCVCVGAASDFGQATAIATRMVTEFGMSGRLGPIVMDKKDRELQSPEFKELIDQEVKLLLDVRLCLFSFLFLFCFVYSHARMIRSRTRV